MEYKDKKISCRDCAKDFVWSIGEQKFFDKKGLKNPPSRCPECRKSFRDKMEKGELEAQIKCSQCESVDKVPFAPRDPASVLCAECFEKKFREKLY
ncbi:MAG: hypothetical protein CEN89_200 [Candidatus Berkelbacteria bacterium Licking1014_7]|uniref:Uncharacterized protein n=1 Tax=Candidatus Berkelbacteria bacterium Licking1014_7 TaxID=2017147 RepID=A0A554LJZ6_9BACT|nr:MAG: hypothetical protein CEN89_200 [Candidatus Berkelbacteria bacterium Licking1014_7]